MHIDRQELIQSFAKVIAEFYDQNWVQQQPENRVNGALCELSDSFFRAVEIANGKKQSGEIKTQALNYLRSMYNIDLNVQQPTTTEQWESAAWECYCKVYPSRWDRDVLLRGASRIVRGLELYSPLPPGCPEVHYQPVEEVIERFYGKVLEGGYGDISTPDYSGTDLMLMALNGDWALQLGGMLPVSYQDYQTKKVPHRHDEPQP